jgi:hypothetical protein
MGVESKNISSLDSLTVFCTYVVGVVAETTVCPADVALGVPCIGPPLTMLLLRIVFSVCVVRSRYMALKFAMEPVRAPTYRKNSAFDRLTPPTREFETVYSYLSGVGKCGKGV